MTKTFLKDRLVSLDAFRGLTIAAMILVNNSEGNVYNQLKHADWNGWTFADTIFPFFLWIVGLSLFLTLQRKYKETKNKRAIFIKITKRAVILFSLGILLNAIPLVPISSLRLTGILQRIAVCFFFTGNLLLWTDIEGQIFTILLLLSGYWVIMKFVPIVDNLLLSGRLLYGSWDPEGIVSTLPAIASCLFGVVAGQLLYQKTRLFPKIALLFLSGIALVIIGQIMNIWLPINKNLWTSSYAVFMAGLAALTFGLIYLLVEVESFRGWFKPFIILGVNAIAIYTASDLFTKSLWIIHIGNSSLGELLYMPFKSFGNPQLDRLIYASAQVFLFYLIALLLYKRQLFIKI